ncbi:unnamed protein product [Camellia sinensis]
MLKKTQNNEPNQLPHKENQSLNKSSTLDLSFPIVKFPGTITEAICFRSHTPIRRYTQQEDPLVLDRVNSGWFGRSPLHVAALRGHTNFVTEVLRLNPDLAEILDSSHRCPFTLQLQRGMSRLYKL